MFSHLKFLKLYSLASCLYHYKNDLSILFLGQTKHYDFFHGNDSTKINKYVFTVYSLQQK
jgi:hypothetical protein